MRRLVSRPAHSATLALALALGPVPALAQPGVDPAAARAGRTLTATGQTKPPGAPAGAPMKPINEAAMIKAQKAAEARNKAWDTKMRSTLGSICRGC